MIDLFSLPELRLGLEETRAVMERILSDAAPDLKGPIAELLSRDRDMLCPALVILASGFGRAEAGKMLLVAASVELLRLSTKIHLDLADGIPGKGRSPSLAGMSGPRQAILLGDFLLTRAMGALAEATPKGDPSLAAGVAGKIYESEIEQGFKRFDPGVTPRAYLRRIHGKNAILLGASMRLAAACASCPRDAAQALTRFGYSLGMGARIVEDLRDFETGRDGRRRGSDVADGVFTLPVALALKAKGKALSSLLGKAPYSRLKLGKILKAVEASGALEQAREIAAGYHRLALLELERLPDIKARSALREVAGVVMNGKPSPSARRDS